MPVQVLVGDLPQHASYMHLHVPQSTAFGIVLQRPAHCEPCGALNSSYRFPAKRRQAGRQAPSAAGEEHAERSGRLRRLGAGFGRQHPPAFAPAASPPPPPPPLISAFESAAMGKRVKTAPLPATAHPWLLQPAPLSGTLCTPTCPD